MAKTSGVDEQVVSLPSGGGGVQGLGAAFETDLNTGTGGYSIPIDAPAGPNGTAPKIVLRYSSAAGNGPFGLGWTLGNIAVARKIEGRIPDYSPADQSFVLAGVDDLVAVGGGEFRPRVDTMHWRIRRQGDGWELTDTRGTVHLLGTTSAARVETVESGLTKTAQWLLETLRDPLGNEVRYTYQADGGQRYLSRIDWGTYSLRFAYGARPDAMTSGRYGFLLSTALRCTSIELHVETEAQSLVRSWTFQYTQAAGSAISLLTGATLRGHAADGSVLEAPALTLTYTEAGRRTLTRVADEAGAGPGRFETGIVELLDWDGDGLPDMIEIDAGDVRVWPNLGRNRWGSPRPAGRLPSPVTLNEPGVAFADMMGNGTADLLVLDRPLAAFYPHTAGGGFERPVYFDKVPAHKLSDGDCRLVDLDGNGIADLLCTGPDFYTLYYRTEDGWSDRPQVLARSQAPPVSVGDPHVHLADMNGDGLQDLVRVDGGGVTWWPYLGNGRWADPVEMRNPPVPPPRYDARRLQLVDVDGDGCADFVFVGGDSVTVWLNQGGVRVGDPEVIQFTPFAAPNQIRICDFNAQGTTGVLWSSVNVAGRRGGYLFLDLTGGVKPYLLTHVDNGIGLVTRITWRSSTEFGVDASEAGTPWQTFHPFPVQCVAEVRTIDQVTGQESVIRNVYGPARFDPDSRTFLGFGRVEVQSIGDASIPTLRTVNVYHLGLDPGDPTRRLSDDERLRLSALRRRLLRTEIYGDDGAPNADRPYTVVHHEYDVRIEAGSVLVPFETRTFEEMVERAPAPYAFREIAYLDIDAHGNITRQRTRVWRIGAPADDQNVTVDVAFAVNEAAHIVSLPARVTQTDGTGSVIAVTVTHYDGPAFTGLDEGQVDIGNVSRTDMLALTEELITAVYGANPPDFATLGYVQRPGEAGWWVRSVSYQRVSGTEVIVRGPRGLETRLTLDGSRQFPVGLLDAMGNSMTGAPDLRALQMGTVTDVNGHSTRDLFDALGRVVALVKPGDTVALPSATWEYDTTGPLRVRSNARINSGAPDMMTRDQYLTGRGRVFQSITPGEGDAGRRFLVEESYEYTARGQVASKALPFYTDAPGLVPPPPGTPRAVTRYDATGRVVEQIAPDTTSLTHSYGPGTIETLDDLSRAAAPPRVLRRVQDGLKRVIALEHQLATRIVRTEYDYDTLNRLWRIRPPGGGETRLVFDLLGRQLAEESPASGRTVMVVDASGNQVARTNAAGQTTRNQVDALDRLVQVNEDGAAGFELRYRYFDTGQPAPADGVQNRTGRVWQVEDRFGTLEMQYDALGHVTRATRTATALGGRALQTDTVFDALGRTVRMTLPEPTAAAGRRVLQYQYNARGLPSACPGFVKSVDYDALGNVVRRVLGNGVEELADVDPLNGRPRRMQVVSAGGATLRDQRFTFDLAGNLLRLDSPLPLESGTFTYDDWYRLTGADYGSGEHFAFSYGDGGEITHSDGVGDFTYGGAAGSRAVTAVDGAAYVYDAAGRMQSAPYGTLTFDGFESLRRLVRPDGTDVNFTYDFEGRRVSRSVVGGSQTLYADASVDYHNGDAIQWVSFAGRRLAAIANGNAVFLHTDHLGTPTLMTDLAGGEVRRMAFGPYGTVRFDSAAGVIEASFTGEGRVLDPESGLICMGRRYLDPRLGRFVSADTIIGSTYRVEAWDRYGCANDNPLRFVDPTGHFSIGDFFAILGIAIVVAALIVAGVFTAGSTWVIAAGVIEISVSGLLIGTAIGVAAGAIVGGIAAYEAGGDIWKGVLFGGAVGGVSAFAGGVLGAIAGGAAGSLFSGAFATYVAGGVGGAVTGAVAGLGCGAAVGFAGGKGSAAQIWEHMWKGAVMGAITGVVFGLAASYLQLHPIANIGLDKLNPALAASGDAIDKASYLDTYANIGDAIAKDAIGQPGSQALGSLVSFTAQPSSTAWVSFNIGVVPNVLCNFSSVAATGSFSSFAGIIGVVNVSMALDKFTSVGFGDQMLFIGSLLPFFIGVAIDIAVIADGDAMKRKLNQVFSTHDLPYN